MVDNDNAMRGCVHGEKWGKMVKVSMENMDNRSRDWHFPP